MKNGKSFEVECAAILELNGWTTTLTKSSGDQGADILAEMGGKCVAIQCKDLQGAAGNSCVQEVIAGKYFYHADYAAVVSAQGFTSSALELSKAAQVFLIGPSQIADLAEKIGIKEKLLHPSILPFRNVSSVTEKRKYVIQTKTEGEIFRAASLIAGHIDLDKKSSKFLDYFEKVNFLGSTRMTVVDLLVTLKLADTAFLARVPLNEKNLAFIKSSQDASIARLALLKRPFEYWRLLGVMANDVQAEFTSIAESVKYLFSRLTLPIGTLFLDTDIHTVTSNLSFPKKRILRG